MLSYEGNDLEHLKEVACQVFQEFIRICDKHQIQYFVHWGTAIGTVRHQGFIPWDDDIDVGMVREEYDRFLRIAPKEMKPEYTLSSAFIQKNCFGMYTMMWKKGTLHMTQQENLWPGKHGIRMDIFPFDYVPEDIKLRKRQISAVRFWNQMYTMKNLKHPAIPGDSLKTKVIKVICRCAHEALKAVPVDFILKKADRWARKYQGKGELVTLLYFSEAEKWKLHLDDIYPLTTGMFEGMNVKVMHRNHEALTASYGDYMTLPPEEERVNHYQGILEFGEEDRQ